MPYIGRDLNRGNYLKLDDISSSFNGSTQTFNLTVGGSAFTPGSAFSILVSVGGVIQEPESAYQVNNSEITFANAPTAQDSFFCIALGVALGIGVPGNGTVNGAQIAKPFNYDGYFYLDDTNNRVGIGSLAPTQALDIIGNAKISGDVNVSGILTALTYSGPISNPSGISTFYNLKVTNNLTVEGSTTTLDTVVKEVDKLEVAADNTTVGVAITQSGSGDILNLYDGSTEVFSVSDGGNLTLGGGKIYGDDNAFNVLTLQSTSANNNHSRIDISVNESDNGGIHFYTAGSSVAERRITIKGTSGNVGIGSAIPSEKLDVDGTTKTQQLNVVGVSTFTNEIQITPSNSSAYTTHLNYQNTGTNFISHANGGSTNFRNSSGGGTAMTIQGSNKAVDIDSALRHLGDTDTLMEFGDNIIFFKTAGVERVRIVGAGAADGKVGIGTINPLGGLHISDGTAYGSPQISSRRAQLIISAGTETSADIQLLAGSYQHIFFGTSSDADAGSVVYTHTGGYTNTMNVKLGTGSFLLRHTGTTSIKSSLAAGNSFMQDFTIKASDDAAQWQLGMYTNANQYLYLNNHKSNTIFSHNTNDHVSFAYDGKVGIGTALTAPSYKLDLREAHNTAYAANATSAQLAIGNINSSAATNSSGIHMYSDGNGRGVVNLNCLNNSTSSSADFAIQTRHSGTLAERLRITSVGQLLINATTVTGGGATPKMAIDVGDSNLHGITIHAGGGENNGDLAGIAFGHGNTGDIARPKAAIAHNRTGSYGIGDLCFYVDGAGDNNAVAASDEKLRIDSTGKLGLGMTPDTWHTNNQKVFQISGTNAGLNIFTRAGSHHLSSNFIYNSSDAGVFQAASGYAMHHAVSATNGTFDWLSSSAASSSAGSSATMVNRMRLDSSGRLYLGPNTSGGNGDVDDLVISGTGKKGITICSTNGAETRLVFADSLSSTGAVIGQVIYDHSADAMDFYTNALRMMRVDRANSTERLQIGAINNNSTGTRLVLGAGNNVAATAVINTQDANINALTLSNWDGSATTNKVNMHFDASGIAGFDVGIPAATTAFKIANTSGGGGYLNLKTTGETMIYRSGVIQADINNSVSGHQFISQCDDNNNGFEIYQQHGSTTTRNTLAVYNNSTGSKHLNFSVRGDNQVTISGNKETVGLVMDGTSSGTATGETGNTIDFLMLNEVNQFTGNPAARIASFLERGNNGFGLKFYARNSAGSFASMVQLSADYRWEPTIDSTVDLGSDSLTWRRGYVRNAYPEFGNESAMSGNYTSGSWYSTGFYRNDMGGLDTNGTYIVTCFSDTYGCGGNNYSCTTTWIVGIRDNYSNQTQVDSVPRLSTTGHSTNGQYFDLATRRYPASQYSGREEIVWKSNSTMTGVNNTDGGKIIRFRVQRIGRTSTV